MQDFDQPCWALPRRVTSEENVIVAKLNQVKDPSDSINTTQYSAMYWVIEIGNCNYNL